MAEDSDPYSAARAGLRETAKWYAAALSALGAALAGGLSFAVLPDLGAGDLPAALLVGGLVIAAILTAILLTQSMLFTSPFGARELADPGLRALIAPHLRRLLPADVVSVAALEQKLEAATDPAERSRLRTALQKVESFAAYVDLRRQIIRSTRVILALFVLASAGIVYLTHLQGEAEKAAALPPEEVVLTLGPGWSGLAEAMAGKCPVGERVIATGRADMPYDGWWTVTIAAPAACAGAMFSVPAALVGK